MNENKVESSGVWSAMFSCASNNGKSARSFSGNGRVLSEPFSGRCSPTTSLICFCCFCHLDHDSDWAWECLAMCYHHHQQTHHLTTTMRIPRSRALEK